MWSRMHDGAILYYQWKPLWCSGHRIPRKHGWKFWSSYETCLSSSQLPRNRFKYFLFLFITKQFLNHFRRNPRPQTFVPRFHSNAWSRIVWIKKAFEMGLYPNMKNMTLVRIELKKIVDRFDVIVITEKLFESRVLIAQRNIFYLILNFFEAKLIL